MQTFPCPHLVVLLILKRTDIIPFTLLTSSQILTRLKSARTTFTQPTYSTLASSPRAPSMYERDLTSGASSSALAMTNRPPLTHPCPHVYDSTPMRPVSVAIQGVFHGASASGSAGGRGSVFGRFW